MPLRTKQLWAIFAAFVLAASSAFGQNVTVGLKPQVKGLLQVDSANWEEAWIEVAGVAAGAKRLDTSQVFVRDDRGAAEILAVDSIGVLYNSRLSLSFVLDNSGSMFHAYDSLSRACDSIIFRLPLGVRMQAVTFDVEPRSESHLYTRRGNTFIAQTGFTDSAAIVSGFWHFFDTIRSSYTPLYDAVAAAITNIDDRRLAGDTTREEVLIIVTDGDDNASRTDIETLQKLVKSAGVRMFAVNFRTGSDARLVWLARHTNGDYYYAEDISDLRDLLRDIGKELVKQYHIRYRFPSLSPSTGY